MFTKVFITKSQIAPVYASVKYGDDDSCPIDQSPAEKFNIDVTSGRPMSDITRLMRCQSELEKNNIFKSLQERKGLEGFTDIKKLEHDIKYHRPWLAQLPSELLEYTEDVFKRSLDAKEKLKEDERNRLDELMSDDAYQIAKEYLSEKERKKKIEELNSKSA